MREKTIKVQEAGSGIIKSIKKRGGRDKRNAAMLPNFSA